MIKTTSTSFRSIWLSIFVLLSTNLAMAQSRTISGKFTDFSTVLELTSVFPNAKVFAIDTFKCANSNFCFGTHKKQYTFTFYRLGFREFKLPLDANTSINVQHSI